jgi:hypothetical protein
VAAAVAATGAEAELLHAEAAVVAVGVAAGVAAEAGEERGGVNKCSNENRSYDLVAEGLLFPTHHQFMKIRVRFPKIYYHYFRVNPEAAVTTGHTLQKHLVTLNFQPQFASKNTKSEKNLVHFHKYYFLSLKRTRPAINPS